MIYRPLSLIPELTDSLFSDRFDRMDKLFSRLTGDVPLSDTPSYNLVQRDESHYQLTLSVPGYREDEIDISVRNNQLTISGRHEEKQEEDPQAQEKWLHRGFSRSNFTLSFNLHNRINVQSAELNQGLLTLQLEYEVPEEEKPQRIAITSGEQARVIEHKND